MLCCDQGRTYWQMLGLMIIFFTLSFVPLMSKQHHAEEVLLATSEGHPGLVHMEFYSSYSVDVVAEIEGHPVSGIAGHSSRGDGGHGRRLEATNATRHTLEIFLVQCAAPGCVPEDIASGAANISDALRIGPPRHEDEKCASGSCKEIKLKDHMQHLHFTLAGGDGEYNESAVYVAVTTTSVEPLGVAVKAHDLGFTGPAQVWIAMVLLGCVFAVILAEVVHHTLASMFGSYVVLCVLAVQHRMPTISEAVGWMDHGTLALLWGMMIIVGVTAKTGIFEYLAVRLYKSSGGDPWKLLLLLCGLDTVLSAFLDNVTTILLLAPVCVQLCEATHRDPRPFLVCLALFGNIGGTATMIGDPPNIIIGSWQLAAF